MSPTFSDRKEMDVPTFLQITGSTIAELEAELANLKAQLPGAPQQPPMVPTQQVPAGGTQIATAAPPQLRQQLQQLKTQSGSTTGQTWKMVHEIATHFPNQFKLNDVRR